MKINRNGNFETRDIEALKLISEIDSKRYVIPPFQRQYVWKESDVQSLVDSIIHLFPIGQILVWEEEEEDNISNIIDGQQRVTSLYLIMSNPFKYLNYDLFSAINSNLNILEEHKKEILKEIKEINLTSREGKTSIEVFNDLVSSNENYVNEFFEKRLKSIVEKTIGDDLEVYFKIKTNIFDKYLNIIAKLKIPETRLSKFDEEQIIEIFKRLNQEGVPLSQFEIFSASWSRHKMEINNNKIKEPILEQREKNNLYFSQNNSELKEIRSNKEYIPSELYYSLMILSFEGTEFFEKKYLDRDKKDSHGVNGLVIESKLEIFLPFIYNFLVFEGYITEEDDRRYEKIGLALKEWYEENEDNIEEKIEKHFKKPWRIIESEVKKFTFMIDNKNDSFLFDKVFKSENIYISAATQILKTMFKQSEQDYSNLSNNVWYYALLNNFSASTNQVMKSNISNLKYIKGIKNKEDFKEIISDYSKKLSVIHFNLNVPTSLKKTISDAIVNFSLFLDDTTKRYKIKKLFNKDFFNNLDLGEWYHSIGNNAFDYKNANGTVLIKNNGDINQIRKMDVLTLNIEWRYKQKYKEYIEILNDYNTFEDKDKFINFLKVREEIMIDIFLDKIL